SGTFCTREFVAAGVRTRALVLALVLLVFDRFPVLALILALVLLSPVSFALNKTGCHAARGLEPFSGHCPTPTLEDNHYAVYRTPAGVSSLGQSDQSGIASFAELVQ